MADDPRNVAFNEDAPASEKFDAQAELSKAYRPTTSGLIPSADMRAIIDTINEGLAEGDILKARNNNILTFPEVRGNPDNKPPAKRGMQSVYIDNLQIFASGEYFEKPSPVGFDALRTMCEQTPILASVLMTRVRQVHRFCGISEDGGPGFEIRHKDRKHILSASEQTSVELLGEFMSNCGWEKNARARKRLKRDNFPGFMAKNIRDSLSMDAAPIETEMKKDRALGIDGFYSVDGATIRLCTEAGYRGDDEIFALQVVDGRVVTAYTYDQLTYEPRNPRSDVRLSGYGLAEPELLIRIVTGYLNALTYNLKGFDSNSIPKGLLHLSGDYGQEDLIQFKRYWNSMVKGINNAWALPVMVSKDQESKATFERFGVDFDEMMFSRWMTFLTSVVCSVYGMSPEELNMESFAANKSSLSGSDTGEKLANSKDAGFIPFMSYYENEFSNFLISEFSDHFIFRWVGLEAEDEEQAFEVAKLTQTVNEMRAANGEEEYPIDEISGINFGDAPVNPDMLAVWAQKVAPPPTPPGQEFGGGPAADTGDFGVVPGDKAGGASPSASKPNADSKSPGGQFGGAKPVVAKAFVYRISDGE